MTETTRFVKTRDSATAALRKLGVNPRDYNLFIEKRADGLLVKTDLAQRHVAATKAGVATRQALDAPKVDTAKGVGSVKLTKRRVSVVCRELIVAGKTNDEVWAAVKAEFKLDDGKKHYPAWYRGALRRQGKLS